MAVRLVEFSVEALVIEERSIAELAAELQVAAPADWPPQFYDAGARTWFRDLLTGDPALAPWLGQYVIADIDGTATLAGTAGFKGQPDSDGVVEIGYSLVAAYHRRGIGREVIRALVGRAKATEGVRCVTAETQVELVASRGLLENSGFRVIAERDDPEEGLMVLYALDIG